MNAVDINILVDNYEARPINRQMYDNVKSCWDAVAKPIDSMGKFEHYISVIGAVQDTIHPRVGKSAIAVFAADNGVVEEGISQSDQSITAICTENIAKGLTSVCVMAKANNIEVQVYDLGVNAKLTDKGVAGCKISMGTKDFLKEPAMTEEQLHQAIRTGINVAKQYAENGYDLLGVGEIGIGNTTTSSAVATALLGCSSKDVTGRGAGLSDDKLLHKIEVIQEAVDKYDLYHKEPLEVLMTVGGYDIAGMVGAMIGGSIYGIPIVLDGFISMVAALVAERVCPGVKEYLIPSHMSKEPAARRIAEELKLEPVIDANMALGEGTGAVLMISLLNTANEVYKNTCLFEQVGIEQYTRFQGK